MSQLPQLQGAKALVYSMGIEGRDLARWLVAQGARVTMSDTRNADQLRAAGAEAPEGVAEVVSGQPLLDPAGFDLVAVSQSVLRHEPAMRRVRELGIPSTSQMRLFLQLCPGRVVGITGSSGKTTTTSLVGAMAAAAGIDHAVGGNIGQAMLERLPSISAATTVILEISHTQLQYTDRSPGVAAVTNVTPNHLDQFSWDEYVGLKRNILSYQGADDIAVLNADDRTSRGLAADVHGALHRVSVAGSVPGDGAWLEGGEIVARHGNGVEFVANVDDIRLRGDHNRANVVMACGIGRAMGLPREAMREAIQAFRGVPHRLEIVGVANGVTYVNDSIATAPERTIAGLRAFTEPVVLLLGGREKNLSLVELQLEAKRRCRAVVTFGEAAESFRTAMDNAAVDATAVDSLTEAVEEAARLAQPGDVVLLAPAGTSFDAYPSFEVRGAEFRRLVSALAGFEEESR